jgi:hypothetical protein
VAEFLKTNLDDIINRTPSKTKKPAASNNVITPKFKNNNLSDLLARTPGKAKKSKTATNNVVTPEFKAGKLNTILSRTPRKIKAKQSPEEEPDKKVIDDQQSLPEKKRLRKDLNWKQELADRLRGNERSTDEKRPKEDIIKEFWQDYFRTLWSDDLVPYLEGLGSYFKNDIEEWGFDATTNPMVAFLQLKYVKNNILKTKLLNHNSYIVFHNILTKQEIAQNELRKVNNYNIIYNLDWYKKTPADMRKYIIYQGNQLYGKKNSPYNKKEQEENRRLMFKNEAVTANKPAERLDALLKIDISSVPESTDPTTVLNSQEDLKIFTELRGERLPKAAKNEETVSAEKILSEIKNLEEVLILLLQLYSRTGNEKVLQFMKNNERYFPNGIKDIPFTSLDDINKLVSPSTDVDAVLAGIAKTYFNR